MSDTETINGFTITTEQVSSTVTGWRWQVAVEKPSRYTMQYRIEWSASSQKWTRSTRVDEGGWVTYPIPGYPKATTEDEAWVVAQEVIGRETKRHAR